MTREIKFRAYGKNIHEYLSTDGKSPTSITLEMLAAGCIYDTSLWEFEQYTGLKDKNGREIYEGDIVKSGYGNSLVIWDVGWAMFYAEDCSLYDEECRKYVEVIGNIHENPELLGGEE